MTSPAPREVPDALHHGAPTTLSELFSLYGDHGRRACGDDVTILDHALQCADLAVTDGATDELIVAALFHDVGWFLADENTGDRLLGDHHAAAGARILDPLFGAAVAQPVALHVTAKRWRCTIDPDYFDELSEGSKTTFIAQGVRSAPTSAPPSSRSPASSRRWRFAHGTTAPRFADEP